MLNKTYKDITNSDIQKYLKENVFMPYLIHVEFEVLNILTEITKNKVLRMIINLKGCTIPIIEKQIKDFLEAIQELINVLTKF